MAVSRTLQRAPHPARERRPHLASRAHNQDVAIKPVGKFEITIRWPRQRVFERGFVFDTVGKTHL
jgi:hypothetical protein